MMAECLVFPNFIVGHFFRPVPCKRCGRLIRGLLVRYPFITRQKNDVHLRYPSKCSCGCLQSVCIRMPVLFFGYVIAQFLILNSEKRARRSTAEMQVTPGESSLLSRFVQGFEKLMAEQMPAAMDLPSDVERLSFHLTEQEWADFLRRMGFSEDQNEESDR